MSITKVYDTKKGADFSEMKQKTPHIRLLSLLLALLLLLCGCARPVFAETDGTVTEAEIVIETARTAPPTEAVEEMTAETAATAYIETTAVLTADTSPIITESAVTETEAVIAATTAVTEAPLAPTAPTRIAVPRMYGKSYTEAQTLLDAAGISHSVIEEYSTTVAAGRVITVRFHGVIDETYCHINPDYPVEVVISCGYRPRVNVTAVDPKHIYLTFDDGPNKNTDRVLEILGEYGVKATFFTLGMYVAVYPERARAIVDGGHLIACHSYSHDYLSLYQSADSVLSEIRKWEKAMDKAGLALPETVWFRFPGGTTTSYMERDRYEQIFWAINDAGYLAADWSCANNDRYPTGKTDDQTMEEYLLASTAATLATIELLPKEPKIMLMHDTSDETVEVLPQILEFLIEKGYTFHTLDELGGYWVFH